MPMKDPEGKAAGRIETQGAGVGPPTPEMAERRAREIARIDGRDPDEVTTDDRLRAQQELHNEATETSTDEVRARIESSTDPSDEGADLGGQADDVNTVEQAEFPPQQSTD